MRKRRGGLFRVAAYFSVVTGVCTFVTARHARAEFGDQTLEFGRQMADLAQAINHDLTTINFNGQRIRIGNSVTASSPDEVLKRYQDYCENSASPAWSETEGAPKDPANAPKIGFLRQDGDDDGAVICFVKGPDAKGSRTEAIKTFAQTGQLGAIGELRYAYAKRGPKGHTLVLTAWTDSKFNLLSIVPKNANEDVRGADFPEVPRLPETVRVISARAEGTPYAANVYRTGKSPDQVFSFYDKEMQDRGWFMYDPQLKGDEGQARGYIKDGVVTTLGVRTDTDGTYVALGLSGVDARLGRAK